MVSNMLTWSGFSLWAMELQKKSLEGFLFKAETYLKDMLKKELP